MYLQGSILATFGFLIYIQFSPTMGNIWYRCGYFSPQGACRMILYPLKESLMWKPNMWLINYYMWLLMSMLIITGVNIIF